MPLSADGLDCTSRIKLPKPPKPAIAVEVALVSPVSSKKNSRKRVPGRFYVSKRFPYGSGLGLTDGAASRFAYQVFDSKGTVAFEGQGFECILRETATRQQIKALFFEDMRRIEYLVLQRFIIEGIATQGLKG